MFLLTPENLLYLLHKFLLSLNLIPQGIIFSFTGFGIIKLICFIKFTFALRY